MPIHGSSAAALTSPTRHRRSTPRRSNSATSALLERKLSVPSAHPFAQQSSPTLRTSCANVRRCEEGRCKGAGFASVRRPRMPRSQRERPEPLGRCSVEPNGMQQIELSEGQDAAALPRSILQKERPARFSRREALGSRVLPRRRRGGGFRRWLRPPKEQEPQEARGCLLLTD